jgi:hypothetical protein
LRIRKYLNLWEERLNAVDWGPQSSMEFQQAAPADRDSNPRAICTGAVIRCSTNSPARTESHRKWQAAITVRLGMQID